VDLMRLAIFLSALLLAGVFGLTMLAVFTALSNLILSIVLIVIFAIFVIVAISLAVSCLCRKRRDCC
jgi:hypothetical protein